MRVVYIGADHRGFQLKNVLKEALVEDGCQVVDAGGVDYDKDDDFIDPGIGVAGRVAAENARGVLICGSGVGMCVMANKVAGVRAALCTSEEQARRAREEDNANVLCLASELVGVEDNINIMRMFLKTEFSSEERYLRRIARINEYESQKS